MSSTSVSEDAVSTLTLLGFSAELAVEALQVCGGNLEAAANYLLTQGTGKSSAATTGNVDAQMIHGPISQYSVENGRSACTCIALKAAERFLRNCQQETRDPVVPIIDATFLQDIVLSGVATYQQMVSTLVSDTSAEHLSAEEAMAQGFFSGLKMSGEIRQGLLTPNRNDDQGLRQILLHSHASSSSLRRWGCFLITKPPETVLVCLPPPSNNSTSPEQERYVLIDTHPRPQQFHAENAYARIHASLDDLVCSLESIFPATELGPDVPPLMAAMYNSFDIYSLTLSK